MNPPPALAPWGTHTTLAAERGYKVKALHIHPGHRTSLQRHHHRAEHWYIVTGHAIITLNDTTLALHAGEHLNIPAGAPHRIANRSSDPLTIIEVQTGPHLTEDDIERLDDDYARTPTGATQ